MQEIQLIFNPGKGGTVPLRRITAVVGDRVGAMPKPTRRGYVFAGWYLAPDGDPSAPNARRIAAETVLDASFFDGEPSDMVLYALWQKPKASDGTKSKNSLATQKRAIIAIAVTVVVLIGVLIAATIIADIYTYTDFDNTKYTIRKKDGEYALYKDGVLCDTGKDGNFFYYMTDLGTQLEIDPETGEYTIFAVVDTEGTEQVSVIGYNKRVLMFKQLTYDQSSTNDITKVIQSIEVHNQNGNFKVVRGESNRFRVEGHDAAILVDELFAQLSVGCGYTISTQRLENPVRLPDGSIDYSEYGLAPETRVELDEEGNEVLDEDGKPVTYDYKPTWYTVTTMNGDKYTVEIGDATISSAGYYARYAGRDTIYILSSVNLDAAVLQPIEALINPLMVFPMTLNTYFQVSDFIYRSDFDHNAITRDLIYEILDFDIDTIKPGEDGKLSEEDREKLEQIQKDYSEAIEAMKEEDFAKIYQPILERHSKLITAFSFVDMEDRENTLNSALPYEMSSKYMDGYLPNSDNIGMVLQKLQSMTFVGVTVLGPTADELAEYGLEDYAHEISFIYEDAEGDKFVNYFVVSEKTEDDLYYAYSDNFDMIVCFTESQAEYLEWEEIDWYEREYFQANIAHVQQIKLEGTGLKAPILFKLDNSETIQGDTISSTNLKVYANGQLMDYKLTVTKPSGSQAEETATYNFRRFFQAMLTASMEGNADLTDEQMANFRATPDEACFLKMTVHADDGKGNTMYTVYRFYRYTERKAYLTIETLDATTDLGTPTEAQGTFYVLYSFCDKLIADANRFLNGEEIVVDSKN